MCMLSNRLLHSILFFCYHAVSFKFTCTCDVDFFHHCIFSFLATSSFLYHPISNPVPRLSTFALSSRFANPLFTNTMTSSTLLGMLQNITFRDALCLKVTKIWLPSSLISAPISQGGSVWHLCLGDCTASAHRLPLTPETTTQNRQNTRRS